MLNKRKNTFSLSAALNSAIQISGPDNGVRYKVHKMNVNPEPLKSGEKCHIFDVLLTQ